ncbi:topoisomerase II-associated protein PAT1 [Cladochytrium replicatum]|nr:topoisomerase II-associated protein PAT1 [Cladochytrium replicatum]
MGDSFFGFDTSMPPLKGRPPPSQSGGSNSRNWETFGDENGGIGSVPREARTGWHAQLDDDDMGEASRLDELLERKYEGGLEEDDRGLEAFEDGDELNDATFGDSSAKVDRDFDFTANNAMLEPPRSPPNARPAASKRISFADPDEKSYWKDSNYSGQFEFQSAGSSIPPSSAQRVFTMEEIEKRLLQGALTAAAQHGQPMAIGGVLPQQQFGSPPYGSPMMQQPGFMGQTGSPSQQQHFQQFQFKLQQQIQEQQVLQQLQMAGAKDRRSPQQSNRMLTVEEVEATLRAQQAIVRQQPIPAVTGLPIHGPGIPPTMTSAVLHQQQQQQRIMMMQMNQAQFAGQQLPRMGSPPSPPQGWNQNGGPGQQLLPQQLRQGLQSPQQQHAQQQRHDYSHHQYRHPGAIGLNHYGVRDEKKIRQERYNGLMTQYEKEHVARIQISQLVSDDPFLEDFYYQLFSLWKNSVGNANGTAQISGSLNGELNSITAAEKGLNWQQQLMMQSNTAGGQNVAGRTGGLQITNQMQVQMQRLIDSRRHSKPKGTNLALEGSLGTVSLTSVRHPRQLLAVKPSVLSAAAHHQKDMDQTTQARLLSRKEILKSIEQVYDAILELEQLKRIGPPGPGNELAAEKWGSDFDENVGKVWTGLGVMEPTPFGYPHALTSFLSIPKGMKLIPRVVKVCTPDQILMLISTLLARLDTLPVSSPNPKREELDVFMNHVIPPAVAFISEAPLPVVNACMRILLERHNLVWLAKSKVGLAFLTLFLSRAEIMKQGGSGAGVPPSPSTATEQDLQLWSDLYNFLFASLMGNFVAIFPESAEGKGAKENEEGTTPSDEVYVWQFLAAMAVSATTVDHQRVLVTEVRDKVLETSRRNDNAKALANVNLFLNALGLGVDAAQLASMPA